MIRRHGRDRMTDPPVPSASSSIVAPARISDPLRWWLCLAVICGIAMVSTVRPHETDFRTFYDSALSWRLTGEMYPVTDRPNHLTPLAIVLMTPLTWLPLSTALSVWTTGGVGALVWSLFSCVRAHRLSTEQALWGAGACFVLYPATVAWSEGQVTWYLLWLLTRAWLADSRLRAGTWLAILVAIKPPLALLAIALPWPIVLSAGAGSIALTVGGVLLAGLAPLRTWYSFSHVPEVMGWPINASLWGIAARLESRTVTNSHVSAIAIGLILAVGAWSWWRVTSLSADRRWSAALLWALLVSPIGSIYYLPLGLGPLNASWPRSRLTAAIALFAIPMPLLGLVSNSPIGVAIGGSVYGFALLLIFIAWTSTARSAQQP